MKRIFFILLLCSISVALMAQYSNTAKSTGYGVFTNDVDNFMSVNDFTEVEGELYFGGFDTTNLSLGIAKPLGSMFTGLYYTGNIFSLGDSSVQDVVDSNKTASLDSNSNIVGYNNVLSNSISDNKLTSKNDASFIIGLGSMGIKLNVGNDFTTYNNVGNIANVDHDDDSSTVKQAMDESGIGHLYNKITNYVTPLSITTTVTDASGNMLTKDVTKYADGVHKNNRIPLSVELGINIAGMALYSRLKADLVDNSQSQTLTVYSQKSANGNSYAGINNITSYNKKDYLYGDNYMDLALTLGAKKDLNDKASTSFYYTFNMPLGLGGTTYTDSDGNSQTIMGKAASLVQEEYTTDKDGATKTVTNTYQVANDFVLNNTLYGKYSYNNKIDDRFEFGYSGDLNFEYNIVMEENEGQSIGVETFTSTSGDVSNNYVQTTTTNYVGDTVNTSELKIRPAIRLGMKYSVIPSKFWLHGGSYISLPSYVGSTTETTKSGYNSTTVKKIMGDGSINTSTYTDELSSLRTESKETDTSWSDADVSITGGFLLNLAEGIDLDCNFSTSGTTLIIDSVSAQIVVKK